MEGRARDHRDESASRPSAGITRIDGGEIVDGTVTELLNAVQGLLKEESDRADSLNARASGLTGFIGIILSVAGAAAAAVGPNAGAGLHDWVRILVGSLIAIALAFLVAAVIAVVGKVLLPTPGFRIKTSEIERYPTWEFISQARVLTQGHLMRGYVIALVGDRERNQSKATWLGRGYKLVCGGLVLVAIAGTAATLDRYVAGRPAESAERQPGDRGGERTTGGE